MALPMGSPREPSSALQSGRQGTAVALVSMAILWGLGRAGIAPSPDEAALIAAAAGAGYGFVAGVVGKVARDELHLHETGAKRIGPFGRVVLGALAALG